MKDIKAIINKLKEAGQGISREIRRAVHACGSHPFVRRIIDAVGNQPLLQRVSRKLPGWAWLTVLTLVIFTTFLGFYMGMAHADSQGPLSPVSGANVATGTTAWSNPGNVTTSNSSYATATIASTATSQYLEATNFGFSIPTGATINGVVVEVQKFATTGSKNTMQDNLVSLLVSNTTPTGSNLNTATTWPTTSTYVSYGGSTNMWGLSLTPAQVNASTFGAAIQAINVHSSGSSSSLTASVDHIRITVYYTPPPISYNQSAYRWFNNPSSGGFVGMYGGTGADYANSLAQTSDGGYVSTGYTASFGAGGNDVFISKYDSSGTLSWSKTWGGTGDDEGNSIIQTSDGGYAVAGYTNSFGAGGNDAFLIKYDSSGTLSWSKTWGSTGSDSATSVVQTADGGYAVTGDESIGAVIILKYDSSGNLSWSKYTDFTTKVQGINYRTYGSSIIQTSDGGYALTGYINSDDIGSDDVFIAKYDSSGNLSWRNTWGGTSDDEGNSIVQTSDGGYAITGYTVSYGAGTRDVFLNKYDSSGTLSWSKTWGGTSLDTGKSVSQTSDGGYAVAGYTNSFGAGSYDMSLAKFNSSGTLSWSKTWGGTGDDEGNSIIQTSDGGYAVAGYTNSFGAGGYDILLARLDSAGAISGCGAPTCQSPTATTGTPSTSATNPAMTVYNASDTDGSPAASTSSPSMTTTNTITTVDVGSSLAAQDTTATAPAEGTIFRLRLDIHVTGAQLDVGAGSFKLQYALKGAGTCSSPTGTYADVTDASNGIRYATNSNATSGMGLLTNSNDPKHSTDTNINQTYQGAGTTTFTNSSAVSIGQDGMWDFGLVAYQSIGGDHYCFKVVTNTGADLNSYTVLPELIIPSATFSQSSYRWYNPAPQGGAMTFASSYSGNTEGSWANDIIKTSDGGYATVGAAGYDVSNNSYDMGVTKYDSSGAVSWFSTWGGPVPDMDYGTAIIQTSDGGYAVTGKTALGTGGDMFLAKFNSSGTFSWVQLWGNASAEIGTGLIQTSDGGYIVTGQTNSYGSGDIFLAKFNGSGSPLWSKTWGDTGSDIANAIISTSDGGYALTGGYRLGGGFATSNAFVQKYDSSDNLQWTQRLALSGSSTGNALIQTSNGGYAVTGNYAAGADTNSMFLATLNSDGTAGSISVGWGGSASDIGMSLVQTSDGGFAVAGYTNSYGLGGNDMFLTKYNSSGTLSWSKTFGQSGSDEGTAVVQTADGGYAVTGGLNWQASNGSVLIAKYDSAGTMAGCAATLCQSPSAAQPSFAPTPGFVTVTPTTQTVSSSGSTNQSEGRQTVAAVTTLVASAAPVGSPFAPQNTPLDLPSLTPMNLRIDLRVNDSGINMNALNFHLQYALSTTGCSTATYADITSSTPIQYYDDSRYSSGQAISDSPNDPSDGNRTIVPQSYQETNTFTNNISALYAGQDGMWQFSLAIDSATLKSHDYCIRVTTDTGTLSATNTPEVAYGPVMTGLMRGGNWFSRAGVKQNINL